MKILIIVAIIFNFAIVSFSQETDTVGETTLNEKEISSILPDNGYLDKNNKITNNDDPSFEYLLLLKKVALEQLIAYRLELKKWTHPYKGIDYSIPKRIREFYPKDRFPKLNEGFDILDSTVYALINKNKENRERLVTLALDRSDRLKKIQAELSFRQYSRKHQIAEQYIKLPTYCDSIMDPEIEAYSYECHYQLGEGSSHWAILHTTLEWTENEFNIQLLKEEKELILNSFHLLSAEIPAGIVDYIFKYKGSYTGTTLHERLAHLALNEKGEKSESKVAEELIDLAIDEALKNNTKSLELLAEMEKRDDLFRLYQFDSLRKITLFNYSMISEYIDFMDRDLSAEYESWKKWNNIKRGVLYGVGGISAIGALIFPRYGYMGWGAVTASLSGSLFIYQGISDYTEINKDYLLLTSFFIGTSNLSDLESFSNAKIMHTKAVAWLTFDMAMAFLDVLWVKQLAKNLQYVGKGSFAISDEGVKLLETTREALKVKIAGQSNRVLKTTSEFRLRQIEKALAKNTQTLLRAEKSFFDKNLLIFLRRLRTRVGAWNDWVRAKVELQAYSGIYGESAEGGASTFKKVQEKFVSEVSTTPEFVNPSSARESAISMISVRKIMKRFRSFQEGTEIPELFFRVQGRILETRELLLTLPKQIIQRKTAISTIEGEIKALRELLSTSKAPGKISFWSMRLQLSNKTRALARYKKELQGLYENLEEQHELYKLFQEQSWLDGVSKGYSRINSAELKAVTDLLSELKSYKGLVGKEFRAILRDNYFTRNSFLEQTYKDAGVAEDLIKNLESGSWLSKRFAGVSDTFRKWFKTRLLNDPKFNSIISEKTGSTVWDLFRFALISGPAIYTEENMFGLFDKLWGLIVKDNESEVKTVEESVISTE